MSGTTPCSQKLSLLCSTFVCGMTTHCFNQSPIRHFGISFELRLCSSSYCEAVARRRNISRFEFLCEGSIAAFSDSASTPPSMFAQFPEEVRDPEVIYLAQSRTRVCPVTSSPITATIPPVAAMSTPIS